MRAYIFNPAVTAAMCEDDPWLSTSPDLLSDTPLSGTDPADVAEMYPHLIVFVVEDETPAVRPAPARVR